MTDLASLLLHCKLNPLDDVSRFVLADYLEEQGDTNRAEFVRLQLQERPMEEGWKPDAITIAVRALRLYKQHVFNWCRGYLVNRFSFSLDPDRPEREASAQGAFARGMLTMSGSPSQLEQGLLDLPAKAIPWLERLGIDNWDDPGAVRSLLERPEVRSCSSLRVYWNNEPPLDCVDLLDRDSIRDLTILEKPDPGPLLHKLAAARELRPHKLSLPSTGGDPHGLAELMSSPVLSEVRELECGLDRTSLQMFARTSNPPPLERLALFGENFNAGDIRSLFLSPVVRHLADLTISSDLTSLGGAISGFTKGTDLRQLRRLDLGFNEISMSECKALARSTAIEGLTHLSFSNGTLTDDGLIALVTSPGLGPLQHLDLDGTGISDAGLEAICRTPTMRDLRYLSVGGCTISTRGLRVLAGSPHLSRLEFLGIGSNRMGPDAVDALAASTQLGNLRGLSLGRITIHPNTLKRLVNSPVMSQVQMLDLSGIGLEHIQALAEARELRSLRQITLTGSSMREGTISVLMKADWLEGLAELSLEGVDDDGIQVLTASLRSGNLGLLDLRNNSITARGARYLLNWPGLQALGDLELNGTSMGPELQQQIMRQVWRASL